MEHCKISAVEQHQDPRPHWRVFQQVVEGNTTTVHCHAFPLDTMAWRAAEYGIDPTDAHTLLDVVLHEPHMTGHDHNSPDHLYRTDQDTARSALLGRVSEVKSRILIHDPDGHLDQIRQQHRVDPDDLQEKRNHSNHVRTHGHAPGFPVPEPKVEDSGRH